MKDSKQVSAQLNQLQKQWLIEKIPTSTKNNLYVLQERFFNIWYLMRYGHRKDRNKLIWLTRFFEIWCSKDQLTERAQYFHQALSKTSNPRGAMIYATALINSDNLELSEREQVYAKTRSHFEQTGHSELAKELPGISGDDYLQQGVEFLKSGALDDAETYIRKAIKGGNKRAFMILGYLFEERKQYEDAEANYKLAIEQGISDAYNDLGNLFSERKQYEDAEANYKLAIEHGDTGAYHNLGILFEERKQYEDAEANYKLAIEHGDTGVYHNLGILFYERKQYEDAEANYKLAIEHGDTGAYRNLGILFEERKQYEDAEANYKLAIERGVTDAYNDLGILFSERKQYEDAERNYKRAIEHGDTDAYLNLGDLFEERKQYDKAQSSYKQAISLGVIEAKNSLAWFYFDTTQADKKTEALSLALGAVQDEPDFACLHTLASVALWNNEFDIAQNSIEKILSNESWQQNVGTEKNFIDLLILLLAKGQTNLFDKWQKQYDLADQLKPLYYAFLNLVPEKYPNELLRMGSELKQTVDEILDKIALYKDKGDSH